MSPDDRARVAARKRERPGREAKEDDPQRIEVRPCIHFFAAEDLWGRVMDRAAHPLGAASPLQFRQSKVHQLGLEAGSGIPLGRREKEDVLGFDVVVEDAAVVYVVQGADQLRDKIRKNGPQLGG